VNPSSLLLVINIVLLLFCVHAIWTNRTLPATARVGWIALVIVIPLVGSLGYIAYTVWARRRARASRGTIRLTERRSGWFFER
jgi:hypothetical protein